MKFKITELISDYTKVGDEYKRVEVQKHYNCRNWDDMQNLVATLIETCAGTSLMLKFDFEREETEDEKDS